MKKNLTNLLFSLGLCGSSFAQTLLTGPSTTSTPYIWPLIPGSTVTSIMNAGEAVGSYTMSGLGDGLGAFDNGGGTFTLLMNHEMGNTAGATHAHGQTGAFVSKWVINKSNLQIVSGADLIQNVKLWTGTTYTTYNATNPSSLTAFTRFCAADLPEISAFYNEFTGKGTQSRIFMNGEESGDEGRAFAHIVTGPEAGTSYQLPYLGKFSKENMIASPFPQDKTIVIGTDDTTPGQVYVYVGNKGTTGNEIEKAGLHGGILYGIGVVGILNEVSSGSPSPTNTYTFNMINLGSIQNSTGASMNTLSNNMGVTNFLRPEDGAWDPNRPSDFYFVTTNSFTSPSRMWRLRFKDITNPEFGGTITAVLDGTEGPKMMDNIGMDYNGHILIQEDPGGQNHRAKIWQYKISTDAITLAADHDSTRFQTGGANFLTIDEESSGIISMQGILNPGWTLFYDQAHYSQPIPMVEGGQLMGYYNPATAAANPEVNITGNSTTINDGNTTISTADNTNFGAINVGTSVTKSFVIQNTNSGNLIVSHVMFSGANAGDFTWSGSGLPFTLSGNSSQTITVTFNPAILGTRNAVLNVFSSDVDEHIYNFAVQGVGAAPEINLQGNSVTIIDGNTSVSTTDNTDFGTTIYNNPIVKTFNIQNTGNGQLTVTGINITGTNVSLFTLINAPAFPLILAAGSSQTFDIQYLPTIPNATNVAVININSTDADESLYTFAVAGISVMDVGINSQKGEQSAVKLFPNPTGDKTTLKLELTNNSKVTVSIFDVQGKKVMSLEKELEKGEREIGLDTSVLKNGEYFVNVNTGAGNTQIKMVVIH
jgi:hypothetical protein